MFGYERRKQWRTGLLRLPGESVTPREHGERDAHDVSQGVRVGGVQATRAERLTARGER